MYKHIKTKNHTIMSRVVKVLNEEKTYKAYKTWNDSRKLSYISSFKIDICLFINF